MLELEEDLLKRYAHLMAYAYQFAGTKTLAVRLACHHEPEAASLIFNIMWEAIDAYEDNDPLRWPKQQGE